MSTHDHDHAEEDHDHWDWLTGPVDSDLITGLLLAQQEALSNGVKHVQNQLDGMIAELARVTEMISYRADELHKIAVYDEENV